MRDQFARIRQAKRRGFTYGGVRRLVVNMNECAADIRQDLDLVLKGLADIMRLPERSVRVHHHVDFYIVIRPALGTMQTLAIGRDRHRRTQGETHMICSDGVHLLNLVAKRHGIVDKELNEVVRRRLAREQFKLAVNGARPRSNDPGRDLRRGNELAPI